MVPLTRDEHELAEQGDPWTCQFIEANAPAYFRRIYLQHKDGNLYLGPPERITEVRAQVLEEVAQKRKALGLT